MKREKNRWARIEGDDVRTSDDVVAGAMFTPNIHFLLDGKDVTAMTRSYASERRGVIDLDVAYEIGEMMVRRNATPEILNSEDVYFHGKYQIAVRRHYGDVEIRIDGADEGPKE